MAMYSLRELRDKVSASSGQDASWQSFEVVTDQMATLHDDVQMIRSHPLIPDHVSVGGFLYDVDTGLAEPRFRAGRRKTVVNAWPGSSST
ncbi:MAG: hypothetical protein ACR2HQ_04590, partial [Ilumatobacteraceae bacterium]